MNGFTSIVPAMLILSTVPPSHRKAVMKYVPIRTCRLRSIQPRLSGVTHALSRSRKAASEK